MAGNNNRDPEIDYFPRSGQIAVSLGFITAKQLKEAVSIQIDEDLAGSEHRFLGEILLHMGWINLEQLDILLDELFKEEMKVKGKL